MSDEADLRVNRRVVIPSRELSYRFTPSGGPGGQHANKTSTRVELLFNVDDSSALGPGQLQRVKKRLGNRMDSAGTIRVVSDEHRSQMRNRVDARRRLAHLLERALRQERTRVATAPTAGSRERRLQAKKRRGELKKQRGSKDWG